MGQEPSRRPRHDASGSSKRRALHVPACRAVGADVMVALCHAGISQDRSAQNRRRKTPRWRWRAIRRHRCDVRRPSAPAAAWRGFFRHRRRRRRARARSRGSGGDGRASGAAISASSTSRSRRQGAGWRVAAAAVDGAADLCAKRPRGRAARRSRAEGARRGAEAAHDATLAYVRARRSATSLGGSHSYFAMVARRAERCSIVHDARSWCVRRLQACDAGAEGPRRCCRRPRPSNAAAAAVRTITATSRPARWRMQGTSPISISIPTACAW